MAVNAGKFPLPLAASPTEVLELVQVKVVPAELLLNDVISTAVPAQSVKSIGTFTLGKGFTVMV
jgi:hypothetical protein